MNSEEYRQESAPNARYAPQRLPATLRSARQIALANVTQQLGALRAGVIMESNRPARLQESEHNQ